MAKKEFRSGLDAIFQGTTLEETNETKGRKTFVSDSKKEIRATFIVNEDFLFKIKSIAYWERSQIKDVVDKAFFTIISSYSEEKLSEMCELYSKSISK